MGLVRGCLGAARDPRAYLAVLYLLSRLPVGLAQAMILLAGLGLGVALSIAGVGLLVLAACLVLAWAFAAFEREIAGWWLGQEFRGRWIEAPPRRVGARVRWLVANPVTWRSLAFLLLQVPAGVLITLPLAGLLTASAAALSAPIFAIAAGGQPADALGAWTPPWSPWRQTLVPFAVWLPVVGLVLALAALHLARLVARPYGWAASAMLAITSTQQALLTAREEVRAERAWSERLERSRRELMANLAHDLRTPVASVQGHAAALLEMDGVDPSGEQARRYLSIISREAGHLGGLIEDLLVLSRGDAVGLRIEVRPTDVGQTAREVHAALAPVARRDRRIALTCEVAERVPRALADPARLRQVLMNLVRNAITYTPEGGIATVEVGPNGTDRVAVVVSDTGVGIAPEDQERIFERAFRSGSSPARVRGFGLGLAIVRDLVHAMDGTVSVQSEPGKGSRFIIVLRRA